MNKNQNILIYDKIMNELNLMNSDPLMLKKNFILLANICYKYDWYICLKKKLDSAGKILEQYPIDKTAINENSKESTRRNVSFKNKIYAGIAQTAFDKNNLGYNWNEITGNISDNSDCKNARMDFINKRFDISPEKKEDLYEAIENVYASNYKKINYNNIKNAIDTVQKCNNTFMKKRTIKSKNHKKLNDSLNKYIKQDILQRLYRDLITKNYIEFFFYTAIPRVQLSRTDKENKKSQAHDSNINKLFFNMKMQPLYKMEKDLKDKLKKLEKYVEIYNDVNMQIKERN